MTGNQRVTQYLIVLLCTSKVERWMTSNRLKLITDKTQFIWVRTRQMVSKVLQICENRWRRPYILNWSHLPWSRLRPKADILGSYSSFVSKVYLQLASTTCVLKDADGWGGKDTCASKYCKSHRLLEQGLQPCTFHPHPSSQIGSTLRNAANRTPAEIWQYHTNNQRQSTLTADPANDWI